MCSFYIKSAVSKTEEYSVYSKFDLNKHADHFINYLEVIIDSEGEIHYAVPSHQMFMENLAKKEYGEDKFYEMVKQPEAFDYLNWLCNLTKCIAVWDEFYFGIANIKQIMALEKLKNKKYSRVNSTLYRGLLTRPGLQNNKKTFWEE